MSITWQVNDRDNFSELVHDFEAQLTGLGSNFLGIHLEGEGPTGAQPKGDENDPVIFAEVMPLEPLIDVRGLSGTRGRIYDVGFKQWSEPQELERVSRDFFQQWQTFTDTYTTASGWTFFVEDSLIEAGIEYNAGFAAKVLRTQIWAAGD